MSPRDGAAASESPRARVERVATALFAAQGFHGTGIQQISEAAGLARGALYYHIRSKEELLYDVVRAPLAEMVDAGRAALAAAGGPEERLRRLARVHLENLARFHEAWAVTVRDTDALSPDRAKEILDLRRDYEHVWQVLLAECADQGVITPVDDVRLRGILGLFNHAHPWLRAEGALAPAEVADTYLDLLFDGLRPRP